MDVIYDIETYPNCFMVGMSDVGGNKRKWIVGEYQDDADDLRHTLNSLRQHGRMVGFNNFAFDYPILHKFMQMPPMAGPDVAQVTYGMADHIIRSDDRWGHVIWDRDQFIAQMDLFKIHHFDNVARATSLKLLEFNMRMRLIEELPIAPGTYLTAEQVQMMADYLDNDLDATLQFYHESRDAIAFREELSERYGRNFLNHNDTKIGKDIFIMKLEDRSPGVCFEKDETGRRSPRQTHRDRIPLSEVIFPYIQFEHPELRRVHQWFMQQSVWDTNGVFKDINAMVGGIQFDFGTGGIHGSIHGQAVLADLDYAIMDIDVASYYPNIAIANRVYPEHLGEAFVDIYRELYLERSQHPKKSAINKALKLALNGVYGDSGNQYSPFFDLKYLLSITINGQLLLCMLAEQLIKIPDLQLIQINTDGLTVKVRRTDTDKVRQIMQWGEKGTMLTLEEVEYSRMFIRDVNNYIAEQMDGSVKRKGAYEYAPPKERNPVGWHQNLSALVVPMAAEAKMLRGVPIETFMYNHADVMDFMLRAKVKRSSQLLHGDQPVQRISRYLVTHSGAPLTVVAPPPDGYQVGQWKRANGVSDRVYREVIEQLTFVVNGIGEHDELDSTGLPWDERINTKNRSKYGERRTSIDAGYLTTLYNRIDGPVDRTTINYDYYINEARKLVI